MHIAIITLPGYTLAEKKLLAKRLKETATSIGIASFTISVSVKDLPVEEWDNFIWGLPDEEIVIPEIDKGGHKSYCI